MTFTESVFDFDTQLFTTRLHAQKVDGAGTPQWGAEGTLVCDVASLCLNDLIVDDTAGGAYMAWSDGRNEITDIYLQRINAAGTAVLAANGVAVCNAAGTNDAAAVVALAAPDTQQPVLASILSWSQVGVPPKRTGSGPIYAIPKALDLAGLKLSDVALFEINEAFAAQAVACTRQLGLDEEIVNVYGSGISLGHPIAATGARMVTSAIHELRRRGGGIGVLSMCAGGGMGAAMVIEVG